MRRGDTWVPSAGQARWQEGKRGEEQHPWVRQRGPWLKLGNPPSWQRRVKSAGCQGWEARGVCSVQLLRAINRAEAALAVSLHHH